MEGNAMIRFCFSSLYFLVLLIACSSSLPAQENDSRLESSAASDKADSQTVIVVLGALGDPEFESDFLETVDAWKTLASRQDWNLRLIGSEIQKNAAEGDETDKDALQKVLHEEAQKKLSRLWVVLIGHGTFANNEAKFNLVGPDLTPKELSKWLEPMGFGTQTIIINCASASAPFLTSLQSKNQIVVTSTKSGSEYNYARFGRFLAQAINDPQIDLDHDQEVSLLEAFLAGSNLTARFYKIDSRLATEHALLNDNGDKVGTTADFYRGVRPVKQAVDATIDGAIASKVIIFTSPDNTRFPQAEIARRDALEKQLELLRSNKLVLSNDEYLQQLEVIMLQLAELYEKVDLEK